MIDDFTTVNFGFEELQMEVDRIGHPGLYPIEVQFYELEVLRELGLPLIYGQTYVSPQFLSDVRMYVDIYKQMHVSKTKVISLQQLCIDRISGELPFRIPVTNRHLQLHPAWYATLATR